MAELLPAMPLLQIVTLKVRHDSFPFEQTVYGLSWDIVKAILSARGLQELDLDGHFYCLTTFVPDPGFSPAPLTAFRSVTAHGIRVAPATRTFSAETEALASTLKRLHNSLERLSLTIEAAPLNMIHNAEWPRLRSLHLEGGMPSTTHSLSWVSILQRMPHLRVLSIRADIPKDCRDRQLIWPRDTPLNVLPWPELEDLDITYPDPEDRLYSHLPPTLKRLSLDRFTFFAGYNWTWYKWAGPWTRPQDVPMPRAREIWQIARKCNTPNIRILKLEYLTDDDEDKLLTYIPKAFPHLESIHLCRYGIQNDVADSEITLVCLQARSRYWRSS